MLVDGLICCHQSAWVTFPTMLCHAKIICIMFWETPGVFPWKQKNKSKQQLRLWKGRDGSFPMTPAVALLEIVWLVQPESRVIIGFHNVDL